MAEVTVEEKLYPPIISGKLPAFYQDGGTAIIAVPFSMNRAVNISDVEEVVLKIKTVQSNTEIRELYSSNFANNIAIFEWPGFNPETGLNSDLKKIKIGQYLKVQMAYRKSTNHVIGYFSTVGVIKYTTKPSVYIEGLGGDNANQIGAFRSNYIGVYEPSGDKSERPYSYCFSLYDLHGELVETSGWLLHNTKVNTSYSESLSLDKATDEYSFNTAVNVNTEYFIQYNVRTINDMEISSPLYTCIEHDIGQPEFFVNINAENVFEDGYIKVYFSMQDGYTNLTAEQLRRKYHTPNVVENEVSAFVYDVTNTTMIAGPFVKVSIADNPVSVEVCRAEKTDNYQSWRVMQRVYFSSYEYAIDSWEFKDFTIEQGVSYKYCFRQYNKDGVQSSREVSNEVFADFEDMFLWDGEKQLKIRFNPKVSSFKTNRLESKMDTIGSRYPFIFRNGIVEYKEFPIAGLISYLTDNNELFLHHQEDLNIILGNHASRSQTPAGFERYTPVNPALSQETYRPNTYYFQQNGKYVLAYFDSFNDYDVGTVFYTREIVYRDTSYETTQTLDSVGYNMRAERRFKLKILDWLGNGKIKMFKSPAEGNYLVRLLNISLTPEDKLGRMLHNFTATAYEVEEFNYNNLVSLGFLNTVDSTKTMVDMKTVKFADIIAAASVNTFRTGSLPVNLSTIYEYARIETSPNGEGGAGFYVRIGTNSSDNKVYVQPGFILQAAGTDLPNIYFCIEDNLDLIQNLDPFGSEVTLANVTKDQAYTLVGDAQLTYRFYNQEIAIGEFQNITNVYLTNTIKTLVGPITATFNSTTSEESREVIKFFVLNFKEKDIRELIRTGSSGNYTYKDRLTNTTVTNFDELTIYIVYTNNNDTLTEVGAYIVSNGSLSTIGSSQNISTVVQLTVPGGIIMNYSTPPVINTTQFLYNSITMGNGVYLECAYQEKVILKR